MLGGSAVGAALPPLHHYEKHGIAALHKPASYVLVSDFGADLTGEDDAAAAISAAILFASRHGKKCILPAGTYLCKSSVSPIILRSVEIEFEPGAKLIAGRGMSRPVLLLRASLNDQAKPKAIDLKIINPNIDCSSGYSPYGTGGLYCTALSFQYFRKVHIEGGLLNGGNSPRNVNADSGISWITCGDVLIDRVVIQGFNDAGIYPGGNNMRGIAGDGGVGRIVNCTIRRCERAVTAKRELKRCIVDHCLIEECRGGVSSEFVTDNGGMRPARWLEVSNTTFRKLLANAVRLRGPTRGFIRDNEFIDWGYELDGTNSARASAAAINLDGSREVEISDNLFTMQRWHPDEQLAIRFSQAKFNEATYNHGFCISRRNTYRNIPRGIAFSSAGDPHMFLEEHFENVAIPVSATNKNIKTIVTYK
ncbi:glycosyl hydrolase family 28-related protein [Sphingobium herbicidovorans]